MRKILALLLTLSGPAFAGASSDGIPQFVKAGPGCNAFWMPGPSSWGGAGITLSPLGQWYAIAATDGPNNGTSDNTLPDPNKAGRWTEVVTAAFSGRALWIASPSTLGIMVSPETVQCDVPPPSGGFGGQLPNAIPYTFPDSPILP